MDVTITKGKQMKLRKGTTVMPLKFVPPTSGNPFGLSTDTRCTVVELTKERIKVDREDGRGQGYWIDRTAIRIPGA